MDPRRLKRTKGASRREILSVDRPCSPSAYGMSRLLRVVQSRVEPPLARGLARRIASSGPGTSRTEAEEGLFGLVLFQSSCLPNPHSEKNRAKHRSTLVPAKRRCRCCKKSSHCLYPSLPDVKNLEEELLRMAKNRNKDWRWGKGEVVTRLPSEGESQRRLRGRGRGESTVSTCRCCRRSASRLITCPRSSDWQDPSLPV